MRAGWKFESANDADFGELMRWFENKTDVRRWGGPEFAYPFTPETFRRDCHWPGMASFSLRDGDGALLAFGQFYDREGHINLARIGVRPDVQGQGIGRRFMSRLMAVSIEQLPLPAYSLYVYRDNEAALRCYRSLGFEIRPYPPGVKLADACYFMTRPAGNEAGVVKNQKKTRGGK